ncbi:MAG: serine/threonine protein kinase [Sandaracinaceae bacterium]|nr:serine/threonine protein kinase [Sandaracinaceae bacterium]
MASKISEHDETLAAGLPAGEAGPAGGQLIAGRYELASMLGRGGMGCVYRVRDRELDEIVALKVLHRDLLASDGMLERFRQEVKLARRVTHKNVARTYDIGEHGGDRFLTMELVEGEPLASLLERAGALSVGEALRIAREMCAGMIAAHEAGVIHRDLKPENVCIARDGRVVLMDFGIARTHLPGSARQTSGKMLGTPGYMAPEQVQASDRIDARADVYAFGAVLYEMLTGEVAWPGESPIVVAAARLWSPPPDPRARRAELPAELARLVLRCMAREPEARIPSARELAAALDAVASPAPLALRGAARRGSRRRRRRDHRGGPPLPQHRRSRRRLPRRGPDRGSHRRALHHARPAGARAGEPRRGRSAGRDRPAVGRRRGGRGLDAPGRRHAARERAPRRRAGRLPDLGAALRAPHGGGAQPERRGRAGHRRRALARAPRARARARA